MAINLKGTSLLNMKELRIPLNYDHDTNNEESHKNLDKASSPIIIDILKSSKMAKNVMDVLDNTIDKLNKAEIRQIV